MRLLEGETCLVLAVASTAWQKRHHAIAMQTALNIASDGPQKDPKGMRSNLQIGLHDYAKSFGRGDEICEGGNSWGLSAHIISAVAKK